MNDIVPMVIYKIKMKWKSYISKLSQRHLQSLVQRLTNPSTGDKGFRTPAGGFIFSAAIRLF